MAQFLLKKISANRENSAYVTGGLDEEPVYGEPDVMWQSVVYIADAGQIWTNGALFGGGTGSGEDGLSAYELAVLEGFTGSLEEWLASLKGADGAKGDKGDRGEKGEQGEKGEKGERGDAVLMDFNIDAETGCLMLTQAGADERMDFSIVESGNMILTLN